MHDFLTVEEAAAYLRVSRATLYGWVHERRIPFRKHGSRLIFSEIDLLAWSKSNEIRPLDECSESPSVARGINRSGRQQRAKVL